MTARTLVLLRHAKAEESAATDHDRELSARGHTDAAAVGRWLDGSGYRFGAVLCSTSTRTRQTWNGIEAVGVAADDVRFDRRVYSGEADVLLAVLAEVPDDVGSVLVIGHAPTIPGLADLLADPEASEGAALDALRSSFPSGCLAVLSVDAKWAALAAGSATLSAVTTPRG